MPISSFRSSNFYRKILSAEIDSAIEGLTANNSTKNIFSTMQPNGNCCLGDSSTDPVNPVFTRSTTCWAKNIDTSPISPWNNGGGYAYPFEAGGFGGTGTLISPRHILFADHFSIKNGKKLIFVDMNNNCYIRTLSDQSLAASFTDIKIGLLDSDLPANVSFCKVAGFDLVQKININNKVPVLYTDQSRNALVADYYYAGGFPFGKYGKIEQPLVNSKRRDFYEQVVGGDSGNPVSFVYNNKIILLFTFVSSDIGATPSYYLDQINSTMTTLGGGYTLSLFNESDIISQEKNISIKTENSSTNYRKILSAGIDSFIADLAANDSTKLIFSTQTPNGGVSPVYIRSTTCWAKNIDLSPLSPWNSAFANQFAGTLISPRHIVGANHAFPSTGATIIFVDMNNNSYTRTITNSLQLESTDIRIGVLNSDLPPNVSFCQVSSLELADFATNSNRVPVLYTDQEEKALVGDFYNTSSNGNMRQPSNAQRASFYEQAIGGDSGGPVGFVYNNKLILLFTFFHGYGGEDGSSIPYYINQINSTMTTLGGGYTLSIFNKEDVLGSGKITLKKSNN